MRRLPFELSVLGMGEGAVAVMDSDEIGVRSFLKYRFELSKSILAQGIPAFPREMFRLARLGEHGVDLLAVRDLGLLRGLDHRHEFGQTALAQGIQAHLPLCDLLPQASHLVGEAIEPNDHSTVAWHPCRMKRSKGHLTHQS